MPLYYPKKGSAEAKAWAKKMQRARKAKKIREAGMKTERAFFGPGGPLEVKNPGERWHEGMADVAGRYKRQARTPIEKHVYAGMEIAHRDSASAARKLGMNPRKKKMRKNPIAIYNPAKVAGTIYNNAIEIRAQKTGGPLRGHYKHIFGKNVRILGLTDGTVLLQHKDGKPLWITREEYERSGRTHS